MTHCPICGKEQSHQHIGWKFSSWKETKDGPKRGAVGIRRITCENCKNNFMIVEYNDAAAKEVCDWVNKYVSRWSFP